MTPLNDRRLRGTALAVFALQVAALVGVVVSAQGLAGRPGLTYPFELHASQVAAGILPGAVGLALCWLRPANPVGWLVALSGTLLTLCTFGQTYGARAVVVPEDGLPLGTWALSLSAPLWVPALFICATHLLVRYPTGDIAGRWARRFDRAALAAHVVIYVGYAGSPQSVSDVVVGREPPVLLPTPVAAALTVGGGVVLLASTALVVADAVLRARRATGPLRMALIWLLSTAVLSIVVIFVGPYEWTGEVVYAAVLAAVAVGVLRYQALGIELVVRRALTYGALTGLVLVVLVGVVAALTRVIPDGPLPQLVAAALIAVGLAPARDRVQRMIDRLLYGERADPFTTLERLSRPIGRGRATSGGDDPLPGVLEALVGALHVRGAEVVGQVAARHGSVSAAATRIPLSFGTTDVGELRVDTRAGESRLSGPDLKLLRAVAPLIAVVVHTVRLADDLRAEQDRAARATDVERRRLRQELHDGLGPSLTGIGLGLESLSSTAREPVAVEMLTRLRQETSAAMEEIRRIIDDLEPAALDARDLEGAIRGRAERLGVAGGLTVSVDIHSPVPPVPRPVAVAALRIAEEALTNVVRHSAASTCSVRLRVDECLELTVSDDGVGPGSHPGGVGGVNGGGGGGVGLDSMRQRAARLGGSLTVLDARPGTQVCARLPVAVEA